MILIVVYIILIILSVSIFIGIGNELIEKYFKDPTHLIAYGWFSFAVLISPREYFKEKNLWGGYRLFLLQKLIMIIAVVLVFLVFRELK